MGTTSLHYVLNEHPQIYMSPIKETNFFLYYPIDVPPSGSVLQLRSFASQAVTTLDESYSSFRGASNNMAVGETSPSYLVGTGVPQRIYKLVSKVKIIAVLRQPVERAYSHFLVGCKEHNRMHTEDFGDTMDFREALEINNRKIQKDMVLTSHFWVRVSIIMI